MRRRRPDEYRLVGAAGTDDTETGGQRSARRSRPRWRLARVRGCVPRWRCGAGMTLACSTPARERRGRWTRAVWQLAGTGACGAARGSARGLHAVTPRPVGPRAERAGRCCPRWRGLHRYSGNRCRWAEQCSYCAYVVAPAPARRELTEPLSSQAGDQAYCVSEPAA